MLFGVDSTWGSPASSRAWASSIWPFWARRSEREAAESAGGNREDIVTDGDGLAEGRLGFIESVELDEHIAEIAEMDALIAPCHRFLGDGEGLGVVDDGLVVLALGLVDDAEIAEMDALIALVTDFSRNGDGLGGVVRDGFVVLACHRFRTGSG